MPIQKALKLPATIPERMFKDGPPSREALTTSAAWVELGLVNILVNSGIKAAPKVPMLMMADKTNHSSCNSAATPEPGPSRK